VDPREQQEYLNIFNKFCGDHKIKSDTDEYQNLFLSYWSVIFNKRSKDKSYNDKKSYYYKVLKLLLKKEYIKVIQSNEYQFMLLGLEKSKSKSKIKFIKNPVKAEFSADDNFESTSAIMDYLKKVNLTCIEFKILTDKVCGLSYQDMADKHLITKEACKQAHKRVVKKLSAIDYSKYLEDLQN